MGRESRAFRRYPGSLAARLSVGATSLQAEIIDYSCDGARVVLPPLPPVRTGDVFSVDCDVADLSARYRTVWLARTDQRIRAGLRREDRLRGSLGTFRLADLLIGLRRSKRTGVVCIESGEAEKRLFLRGGEVVFAASNLAEDALVEYLLREGRINREQSDRAANLARETGSAQGAMLVKTGALTPHDLFAAVRRQVCSIVISLFSLPGGDFEVQEGDLPGNQIVIPGLPVADLIYRGTKEATCVEQISDLLQLPHGARIAMSGDPFELLREISLDGEDERVMTTANGGRTVPEIALATDLAEERIRRSIAALLNTYQLELLTPEGVAGPQEREGPAAAETAVPPKLDAEAVGRIDGLARNLDSTDHYALLGIERSATSAAIQAVFWRMARQYHPDRHIDAGEDLRSKLAIIFSRMTQAFAILGNPARRREYDRSLAAVLDAPSNAEQARRLSDSGRKALRQGSFQEAERLFRQAIALDDTVASLHRYHARALVKLNNLREASEVLARAAKLDPGDDGILAELGRVFLELGLPLRAGKHFEEALRINPRNEQALRGVLLAHQGSRRPH